MTQESQPQNPRIISLLRGSAPPSRRSKMATLRCCEWSRWKITWWTPGCAWISPCHQPGKAEIWHGVRLWHWLFHIIPIYIYHHCLTIQHQSIYPHCLIPIGWYFRSGRWTWSSQVTHLCRRVWTAWRCLSSKECWLNHERLGLVSPRNIRLTRCSISWEFSANIFCSSSTSILFSQA